MREDRKFWFWRLPGYVTEDNVSHYDIVDVCEELMDEPRGYVHQGLPPQVGDWVNLHDFRYKVVYREKFVSTEPGESGWAIYVRWMG